MPTTYHDPRHNLMWVEKLKRHILDWGPTGHRVSLTTKAVWICNNTGSGGVKYSLKRRNTRVTDTKMTISDVEITQAVLEWVKILIRENMKWFTSHHEPVIIASDNKSSSMTEEPWAWYHPEALLETVLWHTNEIFTSEGALAFQVPDQSMKKVASKLGYAVEAQ